MRPSIAFQFNDSWDLEIQSCLAGNVTPEWFPERVLAPEMIIHGFDLVYGVVVKLIGVFGSTHCSTIYSLLGRFSSYIPARDTQALLHSQGYYP